MVFSALTIAAFSWGQPVEAEGRSAAPHTKVPSTKEGGLARVAREESAREQLHTAAATACREKITFRPTVVLGEEQSFSCGGRN